MNRTCFLFEYAKGEEYRFDINKKTLGEKKRFLVAGRCELMLYNIVFPLDRFNWPDFKEYIFGRFNLKMRVKTYSKCA